MTKNNDLPYDEFIRLQLAADTLRPDDLESHVALGFIGLGPKYYRRSDPEFMAEEWENQVDTLTRGLLGLTVALFVASAAYVEPAMRGQAKMGALLSGAVGLVAVPLARALGIQQKRKKKPSSIE